MKDIGDLWVLSEYKFTVSGSYLEDREKFPGLWREVYQYVSLKSYARKIVENTIDMVRSNG